MRQSTIIDIAERLGISASTVSRALSDHPDVSEETKKRVRSMAGELDYSPNPMARSLKSSQTTTIGVLVPEIKHDFFSSAISGIEVVAYESGYSIILCQSNESIEREVINTNVLLKHRVAGIIASISQNTRNCDHFRAVLHRKVPLVFFDRVCEELQTSRVVVDDYQSAIEAVNHLITRGYQRIAHVGGPVGLSISNNRRRGYEEALRIAGRSVQPDLITSGGLHEQDGYQSMGAMIRNGTVPDAVFAVNDPVAIGVYQRAKEAGLKIPQEIAIVGFSNNKITSMLDPQITTVDQPSFEMGKKAAELLLKGIRDKNVAPEVCTLDAKLIVRGSS